MLGSQNEGSSGITKEMDTWGHPPGHLGMGQTWPQKIGWWILNLDLNLWSPKSFILTHTSKRQRNPTHLEFRRPNIFERPRRPGPNFSVVGAKLFTSQVALVCTATPSDNLERRETASGDFYSWFQILNIVQLMDISQNTIMEPNGYNCPSLNHWL